MKLFFRLIVLWQYLYFCLCNPNEYTYFSILKRELWLPIWSGHVSETVVEIISRIDCEKNVDKVVTFKSMDQENNFDYLKVFLKSSANHILRCPVCIERICIQLNTPDPIEKYYQRKRGIGKKTETSNDKEDLTLH